MNKGRIATLGAAAVALLLLIGGCGGDGDTSSASISKAQFAKRANAICLDAKQQIRARFLRANRKIEAAKEEISESEQE